MGLKRTTLNRGKLKGNSGMGGYLGGASGIDVIIMFAQMVEGRV